MTTQSVATPVEIPSAVTTATPLLTGERAIHFAPHVHATPSIKNIVNTIKELGHGSNTATILKEFEWQLKDTVDTKKTVSN